MISSGQAVRFITLLFTEAELETVRRCCRDDDAPNSLRAFNAAQARARTIELPSPRTSSAPPIPEGEALRPLMPSEWHDRASAALAGSVLEEALEAADPDATVIAMRLPPHPGKR